ncbi:MAG: MauE/DoxX family redox-associated membrane protein [Bacteroidia bacterium]
MTHTYDLTGMTCNNCVEKVKSNLLRLTDVLSAQVTLNPQMAVVEMSKHIPISELQQAISPEKKYIIHEGTFPLSHLENEKVEATNWFQTYKPVLTIFFYITLITSLLAFTYKLDFHDWMNFFMGQFFLAFSFFKMLNLKAFSESYSMYDVIAKRFKSWGYVYAFIELALGLAYLTQFHLQITNAVTLIVMSISIIGVLQSILKKQKIQCACLGAVFNLPMSTITVIEDALMIVMGASSIILI